MAAESEKRSNTTNGVRLLSTLPNHSFPLCIIRDTPKIYIVASAIFLRVLINKVLLIFIQDILIQKEIFIKSPFILLIFGVVDGTSTSALTAIMVKYFVLIEFLSAWIVSFNSSSCSLRAPHSFDHPGIEKILDRNLRFFLWGRIVDDIRTEIMQTIAWNYDTLMMH